MRGRWIGSLNIKTMDLKSKGNRKRRLNFRDWKYSEEDIPVTEYHARIIKLKKFREFMKDDKLSILNDRVFKAMFYDDKRIRNTAMIISLFFDVSYEETIENISLIKGELNIGKAEGKVNIVDFAAEIYGSIISMEMNRSQTIERNLVFLDKLVDRKNKKGKELEVPESSFQINFCDFQYEGHEDSIEYYLVRNDKDKVLTFNKQYAMIYIQNIWKKYYNNDELSYKERFILVLCATKISEAKKIAKGDRFMLETLEEMEALKSDRDIMISYDAIQREREGGREEGREEGREVGLHEKESEIIKNMYEQGFSLDVIAKAVSKSIKSIQKILGLF